MCPSLIRHYPSWHTGAARTAIVEFVRRVTTPGGPEFVRPPERIAVFENDGTLWAEQPIYFQFAFAPDRVKELLPSHVQWKNERPFKAVIEGVLAYPCANQFKTDNNIGMLARGLDEAPARG
jgi:hypothetical protein